MRQHFADQHRFDRSFFLLFVLFCWITIVMGFAEVVTARFTGPADRPASLTLQLHVFVFVGWLVLLTMQIVLVRADRRDLHRMLGIAGLILVPVMVFTGIGAEVQSQRAFSDQYPEDLKFFITPLIETVVFAALITAAVVVRRNGGAHKRLMLMATSFIIIAGFNRWFGDALEALFGNGFWAVIARIFGAPNLLIAVAMIYDWATRGRVHSIYLIAVPPILFGELLAAAIWHHPQWPATARWMLGL